jgi:hypothetical protein
MNILDGPEGLETAHPFATPVARRPLADLPVAVIGAGPVGLAAAAHLLERGLEPVVLEAGEAVGAAVRDWGHVPMFSPWLLQPRPGGDRALGTPRLGPAARGGLPDRPRPRGALPRPARGHPEIAPRLRLGTRVTGVARAGAGKVRTAGREAMPFEVRTSDGRAGKAGCSPAPSSTRAARGRRPARRAPPACRRSASAPPPTGSGTACPTCSAPSAPATPAAACWCWGAATRRPGR